MVHATGWGKDHVGFTTSVYKCSLLTSKDYTCFYSFMQAMRKNSSLCHGMKTEDLKRFSWTDPGRCQPPAAAVAGDPTALVERKQPAQTGPLLLRKQISTMQVFSFSPLCMHPISQTALQRQKLLFELVEHYDSLYIYILTQCDSIWLQLRQSVWFKWVQV